ncbi:MAG: helix-hairpin-helix domain-containing protein [Phycisphaerae bacterium]|nr:helix-hairpin-helix domain-containing protein [Phycisphaerae bacterium]
MRPNVVVESAPIDIRSHRVNLNRANAAELATLPEIGPSLAKVIVADRSARGAFATVDELTRVRGVGPATVEALRSLATVGDAGPADESPTAGQGT